MRIWKALLLAVGGALVAGCGGSRSESVTVRSEGVEITVSVEPAALRVGENALWIEL